MSVQGLVAKWRREFEELPNDRRVNLNHCADDLEATVTVEEKEKE